MAISYTGKVFESESLARVVNHSVGLACKAGTKVLIGMAGTRAGGALLEPVAVTDSRGNDWEIEAIASSIRAVAIAHSRLDAALQVGDYIRVEWNGTPSYAWKSAHAFEGAAAAANDVESKLASSAACTVTLDVVGSDWLTFGVAIAPNDFGVTTTEVNSSVSRDDNGHASVQPWAECWSRNGTSGSTHTLGANFDFALTMGMLGLAFPFEDMPAGKAVGGFLGV